VTSTHGSARLAQSIKDVSRAPWNVPNGLLLGRVVERSGLLRRVQMQDVRLAEDTHHLCVGSAGAGKFVSSLGVLLREMLITDSASGGVLVIDPKGECLGLIGKLGLRPFGLSDAPSRYEVSWLDPFDVMKAGTWSLNPLTRLGADNANASSDARLLAQAMVILQQRDSHWDETSRNFWTALLLYVAQFPDLQEPRDLITVWRMLSLAWDFHYEAGECLKDLCARMTEWKSGPAAVVSGANAALELADTTRQSFLMSARRDSTWIDDPAMRRVLRDGGNRELKPEDVALKRQMVFVVIPDVYAATHKSWLRLIISSFALFYRLHQPKEKSWATRRHIFVDEWPNLEKLEVAHQGVVVMRGANCMWHLYCQDFARPADIYGKAWEGFVGSSVVQAFGVNDNMTLKYLSERLGRTTVATTQEREDGSGGRNFGEAGRPLMTADEIALRTGRDSNQQLIIRGGSNPVFCSRYAVYWWEDYKRANPAAGSEAFTLKEVLDTVGAANPSPSDLEKFAWWRRL